MNLVHIVLGDIHIYDENHSFIMLNVELLLLLLSMLMKCPHPSGTKKIHRLGVLEHPSRSVFAQFWSSKVTKCETLCVAT